MKFTASVLSLAVAVLAVAEAGSHDGSVELQRNPSYKPNAAAQIARLRRRYPSLKLKNVRSASTGNEPLTDVKPDLEYYGTVEVGTPAQSFRLDFDTGSSDIWFPASTCKSATCKSHRRFDSSKSSTYKKNGGKWDIEYGDGSSAGGILGSDFVNVAGIKVRQTIGLATEESEDFDGTPEDGLFGLAFSNIESVFGVKTFMDNAIAGNKLKQPIFSVFLPSVRRNGGKNGRYLFGAIDDSLYTGSLTYTPVTEVGYWQIAVNAVKVDSHSITKKTSQAIIDTGTTLVIVSDSVAKSIHKYIKGAKDDQMNGWTVPCSVKNSKMNVSFELGGKFFDVPVADLAYEPIEDGSKTCVSGVQGGGDDLWVLGDVFIKNNYVVFDHSSKPRIGVAPLKY
ncbi:hypothetical protein BGZ49_003114 [Haplosporangium sp. Z 27]|nr:hypothetical protein BGZ49_003114 [Haplosporangium sp. Z 27]